MKKEKENKDLRKSWKNLKKETHSFIRISKILGYLYT